MVGRIATGEIEDNRDEKRSSAAAELGHAGGKKRAANMSPERRREIAQKASAKRS
jgi:general stress protein YciG